MVNTLNTPLISFDPKQVKDTNYKDQLQRVKEAFYEFPKTMKEVDRETGVMRENICRYCRTLRLQNKLYPIKQRRCKVTGHPTVWAWTTNPELIPPINQLKIEL